MNISRFHYHLINLLVLGSIFLSGSTFAHDTNTTHPRLTIAAGKLIENNDQTDGSYYDLWKKTKSEVTDDETGEVIPYLWGQDPKFDNKDAKDADEGGSPVYSKFRHDLRNVLDGVVMEDEPLNRVFSHFQHAYTEEPMNLDWVSWLNRVAGMYGKTNKSEDTAKQFFYDSVEIMGYSEDITYNRNVPQYPSKPLSFWLFGHALHHVEDMSSVAHVHGDAHLTIAASLVGEPDDYEAHYIPNKIYDGEAPWFEASEGLTIPLIDDFKDIWGSASVAFPSAPGANLLDDNLSRSTYNVATFQANLDVYDIPDEAYKHDWVLDWDATKKRAIKHGVYCGKGELAEMFYFGEVGPGSDWASGHPDPELCGLHMARGRKFPHWVIRYASSHTWMDEGEYYPNSFNSLNSDWWAIYRFFENGPRGFYYIEQTMQGVDWDGGVHLLRPRRLRSEISLNYSESTNPLTSSCIYFNTVERRCINGVAIVDRWASTLIPRSIGFMAGFSQYWYDFANTPPYLVEVKAEQEDDGWVVKYGKEWKDPEVDKLGKIIVKLQYENGPGVQHYREEEAKLVDERTAYLTVPHVQFFNLKKKIKLTLRFNEIIKAPNSENSGFKIGFKSDVSNYLDNSQLTFVVFSDHEKCNLTVGQHANCWTVEISENVLADLSLDGRINLLVEANDLNNHFGDVGSALDADPHTPAHRNVTNNYQVTWHNANTQPDAEKFIDHRSQSLSIGAFEYNSGPDETHILLFDSTAPEVIKLEVMRGELEEESE